MNRWVMWAAAGILLLIIGIWVARNTYWADVEIPTPPRGEALTNPFYAIQRFVGELGAQSTRDRVLTVPPADAVIVLSGWHWSLSGTRRVAIERWVESGGRLIVDNGLLGDDAEFESWSGIVREYREEGEEAEAEAARMEASAPATWRYDCQKFELRAGTAASGSPARTYELCDYDHDSYLTTEQSGAWTLRDKDSAQVMRVNVGKGSVTVINASPFRYRSIFDGDHGSLFVAAAQLRRGDDVRFLSEEEHPSLLALVWIYGRPVVLLGFVLIGLALWRDGIRLGPLAATAQRARRSLAEQIRGTGQFALRQGGGEALHAACVRALEEVAERKVSGWGRMAAMDRAAALSALTGFDRNALAEAIYHPGLRRPQELRSTIGLLESARRLVINQQEQTRSPHGPS